MRGDHDPGLRRVARKSSGQGGASSKLRARKWLPSAIVLEVEERRDEETEIKALLLGGMKWGSLNEQEGNPIRSRLLWKQNTTLSH